MRVFTNFIEKHGLQPRMDNSKNDAATLPYPRKRKWHNIVEGLPMTIIRAWDEAYAFGA